MSATTQYSAAEKINMAPDIVHITPWPYTRSYCGQARGDKPLRPDAEANCIVCLDLRYRP